jgi:hypothetical protein
MGKHNPHGQILIEQQFQQVYCFIRDSDFFSNVTYNTRMSRQNEKFIQRFKFNDSTWKSKHLNINEQK